MVGVAGRVVNEFESKDTAEEEELRKTEDRLVTASRQSPPPLHTRCPRTGQPQTEPPSMPVTGQPRGQTFGERSSRHLSYTPVDLHGPKICIDIGRQAKDHSPGAVAAIFDLGTTSPPVERPMPRQPRSRHQSTQRSAETSTHKPPKTNSKPQEGCVAGRCLWDA